MNNIINQLIEDELSRANAKYPPFASRHEGYAVLKEEIEEADEEIETIKLVICDLWFDVCHEKDKSRTWDVPPDKSIPNCIESRAINAIKELIQVAAMCRKFKAMEAMRVKNE